jgi:hypothetical protein
LFTILNFSSRFAILKGHFEKKIMQKRYDLMRCSRTASQDWITGYVFHILSVARFILEL